MRRLSVITILVVSLLADATVTVAATLARPSAQRVTMPDTMNVLLHGRVPVDAKFDGGPLTVKLAERRPWWDSNALSGFIGAVIGSVLVILGDAAKGRARAVASPPK